MQSQFTISNFFTLNLLQYVDIMEDQIKKYLLFTHPIKRLPKAIKAKRVWTNTLNFPLLLMANVNAKNRLDSYLDFVEKNVHAFYSAKVSERITASISKIIFTNNIFLKSNTMCYLKHETYFHKKLLNTVIDMKRTCS